MKRKALPKPAVVPTPTSQSNPKPYEPTPLERAAVQRYHDRRNRTSPAPQFKVFYSNGVASIKPDHADSLVTYTLLADALGTGDLRFAESVMHQLADVSRSGKELKAIELNSIVATVRAIGARDPVEGLLASQMAAIHNATMVAARRLGQTETISQQDSASNMLNKLARTFAGQVETLKRYRADGEQKVTVQHQHVNVSANQAVVGINQGGGGTHENASQSHAPSVSGQPSSALLSHEQALPMPLQSPGCEGPARVPDARSEGGSTEGKNQRRVAARNGDQ